MKYLPFLIALMLSTSIFGQTEKEKYAEDVKSVDAIITAYYDVVSGSGDDPWEFERDKYIHAENAFITRFDENGKAKTHKNASYISYPKCGLSS